MKRIIYSLCLLVVCTVAVAQQQYQPTKERLQAREDFAKMKYGMFVHWGLYSQLGDGEWVMNNKKINYGEYKNLAKFFNPTAFDAAKLVGLAKKAGMKYITLVTRHHDGFSMWDTKYSDYNIMNTPYKKDVVKMFADECHKQGIKLYFYYSLLDWGRDDYPWETGRTGPKAGKKPSNYGQYLQFMKNQITELLTNYGEIGGIWFDGHWDQESNEGKADSKSKIDWKYDEIYSLIHSLQPKTLVANNHHINTIEGEDYQIFERDLPGENKAGYSGIQQSSTLLPLETCETLSASWGWNINDTKFKSKATVIELLAGAAGKNANLLLNIGPLPNGEIDQRFIDTLTAVGTWLDKYGETIYSTKGNFIKAQDWGNITKKGNKYFVHLLRDIDADYVVIPNFTSRIKSVRTFDDSKIVKFEKVSETKDVKLFAKKEKNNPDKIIVIEVKE